MRVMFEPNDFGTLCICAIRYCHGRQTYMPGLVQKIVGGHLKELSDRDLVVMINDCEYQKTFNLYGDESVDKPGWLRWKEMLLQEQERRETEKSGGKKKLDKRADG